MSGIAGDGSSYTCKHLLRIRKASECVFCHRDQLRGELSLVEEGLANALQELEQVKSTANVKIDGLRWEIAELQREQLNIVSANADLRDELTTCQIERDNLIHDIERLQTATSSEANLVERLRTEICRVAADRPMSANTRLILLDLARNIAQPQEDNPT